LRMRTLPLALGQYLFRVQGLPCTPLATLVLASGRQLFRVQGLHCIPLQLLVLRWFNTYLGTNIKLPAHGAPLPS
jgi:hypothetical protein